MQSKTNYKKYKSEEEPNVRPPGAVSPTEETI